MIFIDNNNFKSYIKVIIIILISKTYIIIYLGLEIILIIYIIKF